MSRLEVAIRYRILYATGDLDQTEYTIPCLLLGNPNVRPGANAAAGTLPPEAAPAVSTPRLLDKLRDSRRRPWYNQYRLALTIKGDWRAPDVPHHEERQRR